MNKACCGVMEAEKLNELITVDIYGLQVLTSLGKHSARDLAEEAGAVVRIGTRTVFAVDKIRKYMNEIAE